MRYPRVYAAATGSTALLVAVLLTTVPGAGAAPAAAPALSMGSGPATAAAGFAITPSGTGAVQAAVNVNQGHLAIDPAITIPDAGQILSTALDASGTKLLTAAHGNSVQLLNLSGATASQHAISLSQFGGEGGFGYDVLSQGVAIGPRFALVAVDEQGVVQLRATATGYVVDTRVTSPGLNEAGNAHAPGFIRVPASGDSTYDGVAVSRVPLPNGKYLALTIDRSDETLQVIDGVGTATPKAVGFLFAPSLIEEDDFSDNGSGMMAFSPATPTLAVVATNTGFDVLDLTDPTHPTVKNETDFGFTGEISSLAVAPDGNTVAVADQGRIYVYTGILTTPVSEPLHRVTSFDPALSGDPVWSLAYTRNGRLLAVHDAYSSTPEVEVGALSDYAQPNAAAPSKHTVPLDNPPLTGNSMSAFPSFPTGTIHPASLGKHLKVGKHVHAPLTVTGGISHYRFKVSAGSLPKGLHLKGHTISGTPKRRGTHHVKITAINSYGGAVFGTITITVKKH